MLRSLFFRHLRVLSFFVCTLSLLCHGVSAAQEGAAQVFDLNTANSPVYSSIRPYPLTLQISDDKFGRFPIQRSGNALLFEANTNLSLFHYDMQSREAQALLAPGTDRQLYDARFLGQRGDALFFLARSEHLGPKSVWRFVGGTEAPQLLQHFSDAVTPRYPQFSHYFFASSEEPHMFSLWHINAQGELVSISDAFESSAIDLINADFLDTPNDAYLNTQRSLFHIQKNSGQVSVLSADDPYGSFVSRSLRQVNQRICLIAREYVGSGSPDPRQHRSYLTCLDQENNLQRLQGTENIYDNYFAVDDGIAFARLNVGVELSLHLYTDAGVVDLPLPSESVTLPNVYTYGGLGIEASQNTLFLVDRQGVYAYDIEARSLSTLHSETTGNIRLVYEYPLKWESGQLIFEVDGFPNATVFGSPRHYQRYALDPATQTVSPIYSGPEMADISLVEDNIAYGWAEYDDVGVELSSFDLQSAQRTLLADLTPGTENASPRGMYVHNETLYFVANSSSGSAVTHGLWRVESGAAAPEKIIDLSLSGSVEQRIRMIGLNDSLYLLAAQGDGDVGLHRLNLETRTQQTLHQFTSESEDLEDIAPTLVMYQGQLYFTAADDNHGAELWAYAPDTGEVSLAADIAAGETGSVPDDLYVYQGALVFSAYTAEQGRELWQYDAATGEAAILASLRSGTTGSFPRGFIDVDGALTFTAKANEEDGHVGWQMSSLQAQPQHLSMSMDRINESSTQPNDRLIISTIQFENGASYGPRYGSCSWWTYSAVSNALELVHSIPRQFSFLDSDRCGGESSAAWYNDKLFVAPYRVYDGIEGPLRTVDNYTGASAAGGYTQAENPDRLRNTPDNFVVFDNALWMSGFAEVDGVKVGKELIRYVDTRPVIQQGDVAALTTEPDTESEALVLQASDADSDTLEWQLVSEPENGDVVLDVNNLQVSLRYIPRQGFEGADEAMIQVSDGEHTDAIVVQFSVAQAAQAPEPAPPPPAPPAPAPEPTPGSDSGSSSSSGGGSLSYFVLGLLAAMGFGRRSVTI